MAKMGVVEGGDSAAARKAELKKELKSIMRAIVEGEDDFSLDTVERAKDALSALRDLNGKKTASFRVDDASISCPEEFQCPLSKQLMRDPVIVATGQTYDRPFIQKWLTSGQRTCPRTQQVLSHTLLIPNHLIREMISKWCKNRGIELSSHPQPANEDGIITGADRDRFSSLLSKISSPSVADQRSAAKELRLLTKKMPIFRALFGEFPNAIPQLLKPLVQQRSNSFNGRQEINPDLHEDLITTLLNLSIHDSNKKLVCETPIVLPLLTDALKQGTIQTSSNAAAALFTLSALDSNKALIGKSGALGPLVDLLGDGHPLAMKDAASAVFNLCILHENKARAVDEGAVSVLLSKIKKKIHVDELLAILAMLSSNQRAVEEMGELGAVPCLLGIIRESSCARNKENCIAILYVVCANDRTKLRDLREEENVHGTLSKLTRDGTSRAKRKASGILDRLNRVVNLTHTA